MADWTSAEVDAIVADYLSMLLSEQRQQPFNKTEHRRVLAPKLQNRSDGSIERKHQNISAVLMELGLPYVDGYKPLSNYQALLFDIVADQVRRFHDLNRSIRENVEAPATNPVPEELLTRWEAPPESTGPLRYSESHVRQQRRSGTSNWLEIEARNQSLGRAGEEFVLRFERARLRAADEHRLADRVEHVAAASETEGFDVRSFELNGDDRLIEVKTTAYGKEIPFFLSKNEVSTSRRRAENYHLYRLFRFRTDPRLFGLHGSLEHVCLLDPVIFSARVR